MGDTEARWWKSTVQGQQLDRSNKREVKRIREHAQRGIPDEVRPAAYQWLLKAEKSRGDFAELSGKALEDVELAHTIHVDAIRTISAPEGEVFTAEALEKVLTAYAHISPQCGYTQGMSNMAAVILKQSSDAESAFRRFAEFMHVLDFEEVFMPGFPRLFQLIDSFEKLFAIRLPAMHKLLREKGITTGIFADKWFLTAMTYSLPEHVYLKLWDIMLVDGNVKILFRAGIAILEIGQERGVGDFEFEDLVKWLQKDFATDSAVTADGGSRFVQRAVGVHYSRSALEAGKARRNACFG